MAALYVRGVAVDVDEHRWRLCSFRWFTARDLWLMLCALESAQTNRVDAIQLLLNMLGHPLIGAVQGDPVSGYVLATDPKVVRLRRDPLGQRIAAVGGY